MSRTTDRLDREIGFYHCDDCIDEGEFFHRGKRYMLKEVVTMYRDLKAENARLKAEIAVFKAEHQQTAPSGMIDKFSIREDNCRLRRENIRLTDDRKRLRAGVHTGDVFKLRHTDNWGTHIVCERTGDQFSLSNGLEFMDGYSSDKNDRLKKRIYDLKAEHHIDIHKMADKNARLTARIDELGLEKSYIWITQFTDRSGKAVCINEVTERVLGYPELKRRIGELELERAHWWHDLPEFSSKLKRIRVRMEALIGLSIPVAGNRFDDVREFISMPKRILDILNEDD